MGIKKTGAIIFERFIEARKSVKLRQEDVAKLMGFNNRQIVSNIESGKRKVSAEELLKMCDIFKKPLDYFTDPYIFNKEVSWRIADKEVNLEKSDKYFKNIMAVHIRFMELLEKKSVPLSVQLPITKKTSFEKVSSIAEAMIKNWEIGEVPAIKLPEICEEKLNIEILKVDCPKGISGGASKTDQTNIIAININEPHCRQNFDLAHELFHVLTWDNLKPEKFDYSKKEKIPKEEQLANVFASALLMPEKQINKYWDSRPGKLEKSWIIKGAKKFQVSGDALIWRLVNLNKLDKEIADKLLQQKLSYSLEISDKLFNKNFVNNLCSVLEKGLVSFRKVQKLLDLSETELIEIMENYNCRTGYGRV